MKRIHFDGKGPVKKHYFFWEPWGCAGCLGRCLLFMLLLFILLFLLSQFRSCNNSDPAFDEPAIVEVELPEYSPVPPINEEDVIDDGGRRIVSNRLNVLFSAEVGVGGMNDWSTRFKELYPGDEYIILFSDSLTKLMSIQVPPEQRGEIKEKLPQQIPDIPFMVFEEEVMEGGQAHESSFVSPITSPWYFEAINYPRSVLARPEASSDVVIAVVDSYFNLDPDVFPPEKIVSPYNVANRSQNVSIPSHYDSSDPDPVLCHGSMVAAIATGLMGYASGGIAQRCTFMPVSLGARFGCLAMLQGILYAINKGASIINISAGISFSEELSSYPVARQIEFARTQFLGQEEVWKYVYEMAEKFFVTIVWAAGNDNVLTTVDASKRGDNIIKVSAVGKNLRKADFSNFGDLPRYGIFESTVSAPGVEILGWVPGRDELMLVDGTSFAAPIVTGCIGQLKSLDPTLSTREIGGILRSTGRSMGSGSTVGPVVQVMPAIEAVKSTFLTCSEIKHFFEDGPFPVTIPSTFLCHVPTDNSADSLALQPPVRVRFIVTEPNKGKVEYFTDFDSLRVWSAPFTCEQMFDHYLTIMQLDSATTPDSSCRPFSPTFFAINKEADDEAVVSTSVAKTRPFNNSSHLKKPL